MTRDSLYFRATDPNHLVAVRAHHAECKAWTAALDVYPLPFDGFELTGMRQQTFSGLTYSTEVRRTKSTAPIPAGWRVVRGEQGIIVPRKTNGPADIVARAFAAELPQPPSAIAMFHAIKVRPVFLSLPHTGWPGLREIGDDLFATCSDWVAEEDQPQTSDGWEKTKASVYWATLEADQDRKVSA